MSIFILLFYLGTVLPFVVGIGFVFWARRIANKQQRIGLIVLPVAVIGVSLFLSMYTFYSAGGGFGPGTGLACLSIPAALFAFVFAMVSGKTVAPNLKRWYWLVTGVLVPISLIAIPIMQFIPENKCNELDRTAAIPLISALENYKAERGVYPKHLTELVPQYISAIPTGPCHASTNNFYSSVSGRPMHPTPDYYLCKFRDRSFLAITLAGGGFYQGYDLNSKTWATYDNIDQGCSSQ